MPFSTAAFSQLSIFSPVFLLPTKYYVNSRRTLFFIPYHVIRECWFIAFTSTTVDGWIYAWLSKRMYINVEMYFYLLVTATLLRTCLWMYPSKLYPVNQQLIPEKLKVSWFVAFESDLVTITKPSCGYMRPILNWHTIPLTFMVISEDAAKTVSAIKASLMVNIIPEFTVP